MEIPLAPSVSWHIALVEFEFTVKDKKGGITVLRYSWEILVSRKSKDQQPSKGRGGWEPSVTAQPASPGCLAGHRHACDTAGTVARARLQASPAGWGGPWHGLSVALPGSLFPPLSPVGRGHSWLHGLSAGPRPRSQLHLDDRLTWEEPQDAGASLPD